MDTKQEPKPDQPKSPVAAPPQESKPIDTPPAEPATAQQLEKVEEKMSSFERSTLRWAKAAVILSALAAVFVCAQWWEMHEGGKDTHDLAVAAGNQATWTQRLADSAKLQSDKTQIVADRTKDLADRMKDQADETKTIADQAVIQARANTQLAQNAVNTLTNTKQSFQAEQRAWIGVQGTSDIKGFTETEPWQVTVVFFNSGRTPARNVQMSGMYITSPIPLSGPRASDIKMLTYSPVQSIAPPGYYREVIGREFAGEIVTDIQRAGNKVLVSQYPKIKARELSLYYFGILKYDDVSGNPHETQYCIMLADPISKEAGICDAFNDLN